MADFQRHHDERLHALITGAERRWRAALADDVRVLPFGTAVISRDLPMVYDQNLVTVDTPVAADAVEEAVEAVAAEAGWRHRSIECTDPEVASGLRDALTAAGYTEQRTVSMVLRGDLPAGASRPAEVVAVEESFELGGALLAQEPWADAAVLEQFDERERRLATVAGAVAVIAPPRRPVSRCLILTEGPLTDIDAVGTLPDHRGQGWSASVMRAAVAHVREQGAEHVMLMADADDWPRKWYRRLGFAEAGTSSQFRRWPAGGPV